MADKITILNPDPEKYGVNISIARYELVRAAILNTLHQQGEMTFEELAEAVESRLAAKSSALFFRGLPRQFRGVAAPAFPQFA